MRQGERESSELTDVVCKRRGCRNRLTVIALRQSSRDQRYCSRQCAGFGGARKGVPRDSEAPPHLLNAAKPDAWPTGGAATSFATRAAAYRD